MLKLATPTRLRLLNLNGSSISRNLSKIDELGEERICLISLASQLQDAETRLNPGEDRVREETSFVPKMRGLQKIVVYVVGNRGRKAVPRVESTVAPPALA